MSVVKNSEFRFVFGLEKINEEISNRQFLETIKKVIGEFGFVLEVVENFSKDDRKCIRQNTYFIDLDNTIIELLNLTTRDYFDDIVDDVNNIDDLDDLDNLDDNEEISSEEEIELDY